MTFTVFTQSCISELPKLRLLEMLLPLFQFENSRIEFYWRHTEAESLWTE